MSGTALAAWTLVAFLGVATPGIDTMLVLRRTIMHGARSGLSVVSGIALGCLAWAIASLAGLTALLTASELAYDIVRVAGAVYLIGLGASMFRRTLPRFRAVPARTGDSTAERDADAPGSRGPLRSGFLTNLLNPKVGVFYISLLPQFLPSGPHATDWGVVLVTIHLAVTFVWYPTLIAVAGRARGLLLRDGVRTWMERATSLVLVTVGVRLATEART